jgi:hypothetical protein
LPSIFCPSTDTGVSQKANVGNKIEKKAKKRGKTSKKAKVKRKNLSSCRNLAHSATLRVCPELVERGRLAVGGWSRESRLFRQDYRIYTDFVGCLIRVHPVILSKHAGSSGQKWRSLKILLFVRA